jgi:hypothetical protein
LERNYREDFCRPSEDGQGDSLWSSVQSPGQLHKVYLRVSGPRDTEGTN